MSEPMILYSLKLEMGDWDIQKVADELESVARQVREGCMSGRGSRSVYHLSFEVATIRGSTEISKPCQRKS